MVSERGRKSIEVIIFIIARKQEDKKSENVRKSSGASKCTTKSVFRRYSTITHKRQEELCHEQNKWLDSLPCHHNGDKEDTANAEYGEHHVAVRKPKKKSYVRKISHVRGEDELCRG